MPSRSVTRMSPLLCAVLAVLAAPAAADGARLVAGNAWGDSVALEADTLAQQREPAPIPPGGAPALARPPHPALLFGFSSRGEVALFECAACRDSTKPDWPAIARQFEAVTRSDRPLVPLARPAREGWASGAWTNGARARVTLFWMACGNRRKFVYEHNVTRKPESRLIAAAVVDPRAGRVIRFESPPPGGGR
ncbi:MAG: hypothetical protein HZC42_08275 [Candidatus Eisenbacteria bacterium]|nr:hypothetical protein [Candidatus Eisenbacteria bacterium]